MSPGSEPINVQGDVNSYKKETGHGAWVSVRRARAVDVDYIRSLSKEVFQRYGPYESMVTGWFESGITVTFLALMEEGPVGFVMLGRFERQWYLPWVSELLAIAVEPSKWRLGIGDLLVREVQRKAKETGVETLILHTAVENLPGQKLFKRCGFIPCEIKKSFYPEGQDAMMMYRDLA